MTPSDRDPFEPLGRLPDPEPDPEVMRATIAASREAFARQAAAAEPQPARRWWARLREALAAPPAWLAPAGVGVFAAVAAISVLPGVLTQPAIRDAGQSRPTETVMEREAPAMAEAPRAAPQALTEAQPAPVAPQADGGLRFSAAPPPVLDETPPLADVDPAGLEIYAEDDIRLGYRIVDGRYRLFMLIDDGALAMDDRAIAAETITILDALRIARPPDEPEIIAVRTQAGTEPPVWNAYRFAPTGITRDPELSALIADAPDAAEAETRIRASDEP